MEVEEQGRDIANGDAVVVNIDVALNSIRERLNAYSMVRPQEEEPFKIFRAPYQYREANKGLYEPQYVSIGPYYHGSDPLRPMEQNKWWYLGKLVSRNSNKPLEDYVLELRTLEARARRCYVGSIDLDHDQFVEMLLLDGCFIIELMLIWWNNETDAMEYATWNSLYIQMDLNLMENQIPFFVLDALFRLVMGPDVTTNLISLVSQIFRYDAPPQSITEVHHLLHLFYSSVVRSLELGKSDGGGGGSSLLSDARPATRPIPCAMELREAGVRFKKKRRSPGSSLDIRITFRNGTIEIPQIVLDGKRKRDIMNLVGFEQGIDLKEKPMAAFAVFMDCIINTAGDVAILEECGVLESYLGSREEVALFVNQLFEWVVLDITDHYLAGMFQEVNQYYDSSWHKYRAKLKREYFSEYFNHPWAILSLIAALVLLALTFLQTFFAIYVYFRPPSPS